MPISELHKYAAIGLGLVFCSGFILSAFFDGETEPAIRLWFLGFCIYLPFYVFYADDKGVIILPRGPEVVKAENPLGFRFLKWLYLGFSVFGFCASIYSVT